MLGGAMSEPFSKVEGMRRFFGNWGEVGALLASGGRVACDEAVNGCAHGGLLLDETSRVSSMSLSPSQGSTGSVANAKRNRQEESGKFRENR
jgi:hypothetical protein